MQSNTLPVISGVFFAGVFPDVRANQNLKFAASLLLQQQKQECVLLILPGNVLNKSLV